MDQAALQRRLATLGYYAGAIDGVIGPVSKAAIFRCLTDGPDYPITEHDVERAAADLGVEPAKVWAVYDVESTGSAFIDGRATLLFEPHRFSRSTGRRFDQGYPALSSRSWNRALYPRRQSDRWQQLFYGCTFDVEP